MAYLFDTDAISEVLRPQPLPGFLSWLSSVSREAQFASTMTLGELYKGAMRSPARERHLRNIEERILPALTFLPFDSSCARTFGSLQSELEHQGQPIADADAIIAATALSHDLTLMTGNLRHMGRVRGLQVLSFREV